MLSKFYIDYNGNCCFAAKYGFKRNYANYILKKLFLCEERIIVYF